VLSLRVYVATRRSGDRVVLVLPLS
jgi:hypothetical protein